MSHRINVEDKTNLCAAPIHAGGGHVDTSDKPDVREDDFERFLAHIVFKGLWELILTAIENQDFIFSADFRVGHKPRVGFCLSRDRASLS